MQCLSRLFLCFVVTSGLSVPSVYSQTSQVSKSSSSLIKKVAGKEVERKNEHAVRQLQESVELALAGHPQLKAMLGELSARMAEIEEQESVFLPQLVLSLGLGREHSHNSSTRSFTGSGSDQMERREASLALSQMLFDGFRTHWQRSNGIELGQAQRFAVIYQAEVLAYEAIRTHLLVMRSKLALDDHIANLQTHERIAKDVGMRARLGKDDRAKVSQISARLSLSLANVEAAKSKLRSAESEYKRVIGSRPSHALAFRPGLFAMPESLDDLLAGVQALNPKILSEARKFKATKAGRLAAQASDLPTIYLQSGASWNDNLDGVRGRNNDAFVMLRMQYDLFSGGRDSASKRRVTQLSKQAGYQLEDIRREVSLRAEQAWYDYQGLSRRHTLLQDYVESAQSTKKAYIKQFDIGQRSLIDLLDAENELLNAKRLRSEARHELYLVKFELLRLQGKLLSHLSQEVLLSLKITKFLEEKL